MLVPGSGEPNFDSYVADPYQRARARQEQEVHQLMDKLQPDMIVLDPSTIGQVSHCHCFLVLLRSSKMLGLLQVALLLGLAAAGIVIKGCKSCLVMPCIHAGWRSIL